MWRWRAQAARRGCLKARASLGGSHSMRCHDGCGAREPPAGHSALVPVPVPVAGCWPRARLPPAAEEPAGGSGRKKVNPLAAA